MVSVLLIDDDDDLREEIRLGLERAGFRVTSKESGEAGVLAFKETPFDVVVTDVVMDKGEGVETMKALLEIKPDLPIIAMSGHDSYLKAMGVLGAARTFTKPLRLAVLIEAIGEVA
ncbi:MAG: response regulator [Rhodospirillales bacterium]|nr:response regulator [Rhodospirillales bacterium]